MLTKDIYTAFFLYDDTGRPYNTREPSPCVHAFGTGIPDPIVTCAYLQLEETVRPVWFFSTDYDYVNSIYIDMYTGEVLNK